MEKILKAPETSNVNPLFTNGYVPKTNFWECLTLVEKKLQGKPEDLIIHNIGVNIKNSLDFVNKSVVKESRYLFLTELYMVLNAKLWEWWEKEGEKSKIGLYYNDLWIALGEKIHSIFSEKELQYFYRTTD